MCCQWEQQAPAQKYRKPVLKRTGWNRTATSWLTVTACIKTETESYRVSASAFKQKKKETAAGKSLYEVARLFNPFGGSLTLSSLCFFSWDKINGTMLACYSKKIVCIDDNWNAEGFIVTFREIKKLQMHDKMHW